MPVVKAIVLEQIGRKIFVLTEKGEFKTFSHRPSIEPGEMVSKLEYLTIFIYLVLGVMLFGVAAAMFKFLLGAL